MNENVTNLLGITRCGNMEFQWGQRTYVMGIVNVDPDSFSGDGLGDVESAVAQGKRFVAEGADIIDVGGESTRPGFQAVSVDEELRRVLSVIERLASELPVPVSIDTYKSEVARKAVAAGARMINDVWELKRDPKTLKKVVSIDVVYGNPAAEILRKAEEMNADVVILGTHGKGLISHAFLGSVSEQVLHRIRKPVFIIPLPEGETDITLGEI